jgi:hypothetical protein
LFHAKFETSGPARLTRPLALPPPDTEKLEAERERNAEIAGRIEKGMVAAVGREPVSSTLKAMLEGFAAAAVKGGDAAACVAGAIEAAGNYRVFVQVRLAELVEVKCGVATKRQAALNKVFGKSVDFVICSASACDPVAVIEVDDRSHLLPGRRARDEFVNRVFAEIGLPLVRVPAQRVYSVLGVRSSLASAGIEGRLLPYQVR